MASVQKHIHLAETLEANGEKAPIYKWKVRQRREIPVVFLNVRRTQTAKLRAHRLLSTGTPVKVTNFQYELKIDATDDKTTQQRKDILIGLLGKRLKLVDNYHCDDGEDHTSYVKNVLLSEIGEFNTDHPMLDFYYVTITLEDDSL